MNMSRAVYAKSAKWKSGTRALSASGRRSRCDFHNSEHITTSGVSQVSLHLSNMDIKTQGGDGRPLSFGSPCPHDNFLSCLTDSSPVSMVEAPPQMYPVPIVGKYNDPPSPVMRRLCWGRG